MSSFVPRFGLTVLTLLCLGYIYSLITNTSLADIGPLLASDNLQSFKIMFISIVLEALPFILIGVIVSALLQTFVSVNSYRKILCSASSMRSHSKPYRICLYFHGISFEARNRLFKNGTCICLRSDYRFNCVSICPLKSVT